MEKKCKNCKYYISGVSDKQRKEWSYSNLGLWATGICTLKFPRGYVACDPPHPVLGSGHCFQYEEIEQYRLEF